MRPRSLLLLMLLLGVAAFWLTACGGSGQTGTTAAGTDTTAVGSETTGVTVSPGAQPVRIVFNAELSGALVYDAALVKQGVRTALEMLNNQIMGRPIQFVEIDNTSDPLRAVEATRTLLEFEKNEKVKKAPVDFICGPLSSAAVAGVTFFLSQRDKAWERIPQCSVTAQPSDNIVTSGRLGFIPNGIYQSYGYYLGNFASEVLQYKTANCIHYTDRISEEIQKGFAQGFAEGGGTVSGLIYVPPDTTDFTGYLAAFTPADCTMFWVRGKGAIPFVRQYAASGLTGALLVPMASNYSESQLEYLGALGLGLGIIGSDIYTPMLDNAQNVQFIQAFQRLYPGEYPTPEAFGGWQAIMLYAEGVKKATEQRAAGLMNADEKLVDPSNPADVIAAMSSLNMETPSGYVTVTPYSSGKTYLATRDFFILRSKDVGGGRIAWAPIKTYAQVLLGP